MFNNKINKNIFYFKYRISVNKEREKHTPLPKIISFLKTIHFFLKRNNFATKNLFSDVKFFFFQTVLLFLNRIWMILEKTFATTKMNKTQASLQKKIDRVFFKDPS